MTRRAVSPRRFVHVARRVRLAWLLLAALCGSLAPPATRVSSAAGAWTTYLRPEIYTDLLATADTVWCATQDAGLLTFDRNSGQWGSITRDPGGLASNHLSALAFDRDGTLWIGTRDAGVSRLGRDGSWGILGLFDALPSVNVNSLRAQGDTLWIGTDRGLALFNGVEITGQLGSPSPFASDDITGIAVLGDSVWVSTGAGVYYSRLSTALAAWTATPTGLPAGRVDALGTDGRDVWALALNRLWIARPGNQWAIVPRFGAVYEISDDFGTVAAATDSGVFVWTSPVWSPSNTSLISYPSQRLAFATGSDAAGTLFAANIGGFYAQASGGASWSQYYPPGPPGNNVQNVVTGAGRIFIGTFDEGIGRFDGATWTAWLPGDCTTNCASSFYNPVFAFGMLIDQQGDAWAGNWNVATDHMVDSGPVPVVTHFWVGASLDLDHHTWLWSAAADSSGGRWFGMDAPNIGSDLQHVPDGIDYYDASGAFAFNYQRASGDSALNMADNQVRSLEYDQTHNEMWVGFGGHGVQSFSLASYPGSKKLTFNDVPDAIQLDVFAAIPYGDSLWVFNTNDLRLYTGHPFVNPGVAFSIPAGPAPRGAIHPADVAADGSLWLGTANGVRVYHPGGATEDINPANSPLADQEVRTIRIDRSTGVVWIATAQGLNRFDPAYTPPPVPRLASLRVHVYPNPAYLVQVLGVPLRVLGNGQTYTGHVYSVDGRLVRRLDAAGNGGLVWDGRDGGGSLVLPGLYFIRVEAGGRSATARVTLLR